MSEPKSKSRSILAGLKIPKPQPKGPVWAGPSGEGPNGGITFSLLRKFLECRERFRVRVIEGLRCEDGFSHRLEYGNMWHVCEEIHANVGNIGVQGSAALHWESGLLAYVQKLMTKYPLQREQIDHWYNVCKIQFPLYVEYWSKHLDVVDRTPLLQEQVFDVPYTLPSGRTVRLRGKWDSVDLAGKGKDTGVWLMENKSKGDIDAVVIQRQLTQDLQTMTYMVALRQWVDDPNNKASDPKEFDYPLAGVRYNCVRRPLSGGKGTIVRHKPSKSNPQGESKEEYYKRLGGIIAEAPQDYFMRWNVVVTPGDVKKFRTQVLDPILEQLCDWYNWISDSEVLPFDLGRAAIAGFEPVGPSVPGGGVHWRTPFGIGGNLDEYGSEYDDYLDSGSTVGLRRETDLFPELK